MVCFRTTDNSIYLKQNINVKIIFYSCYFPGVASQTQILTKTTFFGYLLQFFSNKHQRLIKFKAKKAIVGSFKLMVANRFKATYMQFMWMSQ